MSSAILIPAAFFRDSETDRYILPNGEDMSKFWDIVQIEKAEGTMKDFETTDTNWKNIPPMYLYKNKKYLMKDSCLIFDE